MIKKLLEKYIQKSKNKGFLFDENISSSVLVVFTLKKCVAFLRGLMLLDIGRRGKFIFLGKGVQIFNKKNLICGTNVNIGDYVKLSALGKGTLKMGNNVNIGSFSQIIISTSMNNIGSNITIGDNVGIGEFAYVGGGGGAIIGSDTIIGQYFSVHPENHNFIDTARLIREQGVSRRGILIGENCWIGAKVTILDGVAIGDNCVVAAGSVVVKSFPSDSVIAGVPARVIKIR